MKNKKLKRFKYTRGCLVSGLLLLFFVSLLVFLKMRNNSARVDFGARTTSDAASAQQDFNSGTTEEGGNKKSDSVAKDDRGTAVVTDTGGISSGKTGNPKVSNTGEITVYQPGDGIRIRSGQEIFGTSTLPEVQYRLIDSESGVIATGRLSVVKGDFSGILSFSTRAIEGRLDIFAARPDASEYSVVEVAIKFGI